MDYDTRFRLAVSDWLQERLQLSLHGLVSWRQLVSFGFEGVQAPLIGQKGIWKPRVLNLPISVSTAPPKPNRPAPYDDEVGEGGTILYRYRGTDPLHPDNLGVRQLMEERKPLLYLVGIEKGVYVTFWPTYVVSDQPERLTFVLQQDDVPVSGRETLLLAEGTEARRRYVTTTAQHRVHQAQFRAEVMRAYRRRCTVCRLGHDRLLDAAHIIPDRDPEGEASVRNGLALCKIHHAAFDTHILGIDPEYVVHIRRDVLEEIDGPMLRHGLQDVHGQELLVLPRTKHELPSPRFLEKRYEEFKLAR